MMIRACLVFVMLTLLASCTVRSNQMDLARYAATGAGGSEDRFDVDQFAWRLQFNDMETSVYAISVGDGIVFANEQGLEVAFDGWDILVVSGMPGALGMITVDKSQDPRVHRAQGLGETFAVACRESQQTSSGWRTRCEHRTENRVYPMNHEIDLSSDGRIMRIEASLVPGTGPLVLEPKFAIED